MGSPYIFAIKERFRILEKYYPNENYSEDFSPLSGFEPKYQPNKWNNKESVKYNHNCYAYVLNTIAKREGKPQPGYFANFPPINKDDYNCQAFYERLKKDIPSLYLTTFNEKCKKGFYKGFIAIDNKEEDQDYHFYRQDNTGYWSHKPGRQDAVDYDSDFKKIKNPVIANRKYKYFNYSKPCFFFCLNDKFSKSKSKTQSH
jgi:hypothetical protein